MIKKRTQTRNAWRSVEALIGKRIGAGTYGFVHEQNSDPEQRVIKVYKQPSTAGPCGPLLREWAVLAAMRGQFNCLPAYNFSVFPRYTLTLPRCAPLWPGALCRSNGGQDNGTMLKALQNCAFDIVLQLRAMKALSGVEHRDIKPNNVVATVWRDGKRRLPAKTDRIDTWCFHLIDYGATKHSSCYPTHRVTTHAYRAPEKLFFQTLFADSVASPQSEKERDKPASKRRKTFDSGSDDSLAFPALDTEYWSARFDRAADRTIQPVMKMRQTDRVDVWSVGVLLFELATGEFFVPLKIWSHSHVCDENDRRKGLQMEKTDSIDSSSEEDAIFCKKKSSANASEKRSIERQVFCFLAAQRDAGTSLPAEWCDAHSKLRSAQKDQQNSTENKRNVLDTLPIACRQDRWQTRLRDVLQSPFDMQSEFEKNRYTLFEDFLTQCLQLDPRERASLAKCWKHSFIAQLLDTSLSSSSSLSTGNRDRRLESAALLEQHLERRLKNDAKHNRFAVELRVESLLLVRYLFDVGCDVGLRCHTIFAALRLLEQCMCDEDPEGRRTSKRVALLCLRLASKMCGDNGLHLPVARQRLPLARSCTAEQEKTLFMRLLPHLCEAVRFNMWSCATRKQCARVDVGQQNETQMHNKYAECEMSWLQTPHIGATERDDPSSLFCSLRRACLDPFMWNKPIFSIVEAVLWARAVQGEIVETE